jgi:mitochondrial cardiolipin hydrolase
MGLKSVIGGSIFAIAVFAFASTYFHKYHNDKKRKVVKKEIHEVIMLAHGVGEYKKSKYSKCMITHSMDRLLFYLNSPKHTLDICMYVFTNLDLVNVIMKLHYRGVKVRFIIDADMAYSTGSCIKKLEKLGVPVRWMKSTNLMHHKFCIVDASSDNANTTPLVIAGSLNWTTQALYGNWEDMIVTSQQEIVSQYIAEYERLWTMFRPVVDLI